MSKNNYSTINLWADAGIKKISKEKTLRIIGALLEDENGDTLSYSKLIDGKKKLQKLEAMAVREGLEISGVYLNENSENIRIIVHTDYKSLAMIMDPENNGEGCVGKDKCVLGLRPILRKLEEHFKEVNYKFVNSKNNKADKICHNASIEHQENQTVKK